MKEFNLRLRLEGEIHNLQIALRGSLFKIRMDGKPLGAIWRDEELGGEWNSFDKPLEHLLPQIGKAIVKYISQANVQVMP